MHFYGLNLGPPGTGPSWTLGSWIEQTRVKDHQAMLHTKFQAPEQSSSEEEDFEVYFIFEPKTPHRRAISDPRATI